MSHFTIYASDLSTAIGYVFENHISRANLSYDTLPDLKACLDRIKRFDEPSEVIKQFTGVINLINPGVSSDIIIDCLIIYFYISTYIGNNEIEELQELHDAIFNTDKDFE